jgi:hypothetical protein
MGSTATGCLEDLRAQSGLEGRGKRSGTDVPAEADRLPQRGHKDLAVGTGAEMFSNFLADVD